MTWESTTLSKSIGMKTKERFPPRELTYNEGTERSKPPTESSNSRCAVSAHVGQVQTVVSIFRMRKRGLRESSEVCEKV